MALTAGQARELAAAVSLEAAQAKKLGRRKKVTAPNLASLMFLVEEGGKTLLLTGDGHHEDILKGLQHHGKLEAHGGITRTCSRCSTTAPSTTSTCPSVSGDRRSLRLLRQRRAREPGSDGR